MNRVLTSMTGIKAEQINGKQSHEIDYMLALISDDVYIKTTMGIGDYVRLSDGELLNAGIEPANLRNETTGFQAGIYRNGDLHIVAFAGTNDLKDILTNLRQGFGFDEAQYHFNSVLMVSIQSNYNHREDIIDSVQKLLNENEVYDKLILFLTDVRSQGGIPLCI